MRREERYPSKGGGGGQPVIVQLDLTKLDLVLFALAHQARAIRRLSEQVAALAVSDIDRERMKVLTTDIDAESKKMEEALAAFSDPPGTGKSTT